MKISEMIAKLQEILKEHGDLEALDQYDGFVSPIEEGDFRIDMVCDLDMEGETRIEELAYVSSFRWQGNRTNVRKAVIL